MLGVRLLGEREEEASRMSLHSWYEDTMCTFLFKIEATTILFFPAAEGRSSGSDRARSWRRDEMNDSGEEWKEKD